MQSGVPTKCILSLAEDGMESKPIVGVDVSKVGLDCGFAGIAAVERIANEPAAVAVWLDRVLPSMVAFEPTGGYERVLRDGLRERSVLFIRVHPNEIIAFRQSRGIKAKSDPIDARLIAAFAAEELPRRGLRPSIIADDDLRELAARRRQIVDMLQAERCRLALTRASAVRSSLTLMIDLLKQNLAVLEAELAKYIASNEEMAELSRLLQSVKGIGPMTATSLIAELPELGHLSGKEIAALVGLAPRTRRSGKARFREPVSYGRPGVRRAIFNAARSSIRHPSPFKDFYEHLVTENQRPGKVALTAVMRKILVTANAIARDKQPWRSAE
jgi:transposase